jgi:hypothetical protein
MKYTILFLLMLLPTCGFCDRFWIQKSAQGANEDIKTIENEGGWVKDVRVTRINDYNETYTIVYLSGEDVKNLN